MRIHIVRMYSNIATFSSWMQLNDDVDYPGDEVATYNYKDGSFRIKSL